ncbi:MAG: tetratricopeptide repeat protein [Candidatus Methanoperedens sp.]|nr:tetratricopeptide repeat protein [Candidatus Methanoperedens sp.]MCZ7369666.1 tetratricopeptide repeat protein [Candidatus Methanoperedens sp.]
MRVAQNLSVSICEMQVEQYSKARGKAVKNASILRALGKEALYLGKLDEAFNYFIEALSVDEEQKDHIGKAIDLNNIGSVYKQWENLGHALAYFKKALEIAEELKDARNAAVVRGNMLH